MSTYNRCGCTSEDCRVNGCLTQRQRNETGGVRVQAIEQERADFEAWAEKRGVWPRLTHEEIFSAGYQAGRAALQTQKPEPNDLMLSGVIRMPFEMSMATEISRVQFYHRAQQALNELEALQSQDRADVALRQHITNLTTIVRMPNAEYVADKHNDAVGYLRERFIDHARRIEGGET